MIPKNLSKTRVQFGHWLRDQRNAAKISKRGASRMLGYASDGVLNGVEQGFSPIPLHHIHHLARIYNIDVDEILVRLKKLDAKTYERYNKLEKEIATHTALKTLEWIRKRPEIKEIESRIREERKKS